MATGGRAASTITAVVRYCAWEGAQMAEATDAVVKVRHRTSKRRKASCKDFSPHLRAQGVVVDASIRRHEGLTMAIGSLMPRSD
jgi:hypothetical protein